jgi:hypothetical protein
LYEHAGLLRELRSVSTRYAAGRSSVVLPRIGGTHGDLAQALAIAVLEHDQYATGALREKFGRPSGVIGSQGSLYGNSDMAAISRIFNLPPESIYGGGR